MSQNARLTSISPVTWVMDVPTTELEKKLLNLSSLTRSAICAVRSFV